MYHDIIDQLLNELNESICKCRLDKKLNEMELNIMNKSLYLGGHKIKNKDIKRLINLCMIEGDFKKMETIGFYLLKEDKNLIKTLNIYEVIATSNIDCICEFITENKALDKFSIDIFVQAIIETQSIDIINKIIGKGSFHKHKIENAILNSNNEFIILEYSKLNECNQLFFQNKLIDLAKINHSSYYIIKYYLNKKPIFFNNIEETILTLPIDFDNIDLIIKYILENKNCKRELFDCKISKLKNEKVVLYYNSILDNLSLIDDEKQKVYSI